ncbi:hypothetical protein BHM03_00014234 [Ensete ventricosum]|uniref:Uncharacterized protein n=1 Tax=Ensete ventricosum TaxID=4639 RepID=A0A426YT16_ENSVE|nr:hypothetical protein B296_00048856 [Ensete ventricosum]RZR86937.1 hypothetical protein BHM03_00014234 [Ensete ventricosum]
MRNSPTTPAVVERDLPKTREKTTLTRTLRHPPLALATVYVGPDTLSAAGPHRGARYVSHKKEGWWAGREADVGIVIRRVNCSARTSTLTCSDSLPHSRYSQTLVSSLLGLLYIYDAPITGPVGVAREQEEL